MINRQERKLWVFAIMFMSLLIILPMLPAEAKYKAPKKIMSAASQQTGSLYVTYMAAFAKLMNDAFDNLSVNVEPGGSSQNVVLVHNKKAEFGITSSSQCYMGFWGIGWAQKMEKYQNIRALFPSYPAICAIWVLEDSPIKTFPKDVEDKVICLGPRGSASDVMGRQIFEMFNIKSKRIVNASYADMVGMMTDRLVDVTLNIGGHPAGFVQELETRHKLRFIKVDDAVMKKFQGKYPYYGTSTLKQVYKGMTEPMDTLAIMNFIITQKDLPEDFIYYAVKAVWENVKAIHSAVPAVFVETDFKNLKMIPIPFHSGAIKYYKEKGIALPAPAKAP